MLNSQRPGNQVVAPHENRYHLNIGKAKRTLFYEQIVHTKTYERNQNNEKTNKERISKKTRLYGRLSISIVDTTNLQ
jgi:hypothetical protein